MSRALLPLLALPLLAGVVGAAVLLQQDMAVTPAAQTPSAALAGGDQGTPTLGASGTAASVALGSLPLLVADDVLRLASTDDAWEVHAEYVGHSGFGGLLDTITVRLDDGSLDVAQIQVAAGSPVTQSGSPVDLPLGSDTQVQAIGLGTGTLSFDLVMSPDASAQPEIRYRVDLVVG